VPLLAGEEHDEVVLGWRAYATLLLPAVFLVQLATAVVPM
jgi:hypothetical protein